MTRTSSLPLSKNATATCGSHTRHSFRDPIGKLKQLLKQVENMVG